MRRTRAADNTGVLPAMVDTEAQGYHTAGPPATVFSADHANILTEELAAIAVMKGASLDAAGTNLDQCAEALEGVKAIEAKNVEATAITSYWKLTAIASTDATIGEDDGGVIHAAAIASDSCKARGFESAAIASEDSNAGNAGGTSNHVAVIASNRVAVEGDESAAIAAECTISGTATSTATRGAMVASSWDSAGTKLVGDDVAVIAANDSTVDASQSAIVGGRDNVINATTGTAISCGILGGDTNSIEADDATDCVILGGLGNTIDGAEALNDAIVAGTNNTIDDANGAAIIGGDQNTIEAGADYSAMVGCHDSDLSEYSSVALASRYLDSDAGGNEANYMVAGGYHATVPTAPSWLIRSNGGVIHATNTTVQSADYAEMFPNADGAAHAPGRLLTRAGKGCRLASRRDRVLGVVSVMPTVLGNADGLHWHGTYERDEWGAEVWEDVEDVVEVGPSPRAAAEARRRHTEYRSQLAARAREIKATTRAIEDADRAARRADEEIDSLGKMRVPPRHRTAHDERLAAVRAAAEEARSLASDLRARLGEIGAAVIPEPDLSDLDLRPRVRRRPISQRKLSPAWDRERKHTPRTKRPNEWTKVGLLGQLWVAVDATVGEGDFVEPGDTPGIGTRTAGNGPAPGRPVECMEITSPFDEARGYAIALCLVG